MDDKAARGRSAIEDRHPQRKLTSASARAAALAYISGDSRIADIANEHGVDRTTILNLLEGRTWRRATADLRPIRIRPESRGRIGEEHPRARLTEYSARSIADAYIAGDSVAVLADRHGVSRGAVASIIRGQTWAHVTAGMGLDEVDARARQLAGLRAARAAQRAENEARTHCKYGHERNAANTRYDANGRPMYCRVCNRGRNQVGRTAA
jgi:transposase-like protein